MTNRKKQAERAEAQVERLKGNMTEMVSMDDCQLRIYKQVKRAEKAEVRIRELKEGVRLMLGAIPDGWEVPLLYRQIAAQVKKTLEAS